MNRAICVSTLRGSDPPTYFRCIPRDISNIVDEYLAAAGCIRRVAEPMQLIHTYKWCPPPDAPLRYLGLRLYYVEAHDYRWLDGSTCHMIIKHMLHLFRGAAPSTPAASPIGMRPAASLDLRTAFGYPLDYKSRKFYLDTYGRPCVAGKRGIRILSDPFGERVLSKTERANPGYIGEISGQYSAGDLAKGKYVGTDAAGNVVHLVSAGASVDVVILSAADPVATIRSTTMAMGRASLGPDGHLCIACVRTGCLYLYR